MYWEYLYSCVFIYMGVVASVVVCVCFEDEVNDY